MAVVIFVLRPLLVTNIEQQYSSKNTQENDTNMAILLVKLVLLDAVQPRVLCSCSIQSRFNNKKSVNAKLCLENIHTFSDLGFPRLVLLFTLCTPGVKILMKVQTKIQYINRITDFIFLSNTITKYYVICLILR